MDAREKCSICIQYVVFACLFFAPSAARAGDAIVIGGTEQQKGFVSCVAEVSADELRALPNSDQPMTFVILDHQKFLQARESFGAYRTKLAFSILTMRRVYLSSRVFTDFDTALRCVPHELGHFVMQDGFEDHAEIAAERIRRRVRQSCASRIH